MIKNFNFSSFQLRYDFHFGRPEFNIETIRYKIKTISNLYSRS